MCDLVRTESGYLNISEFYAHRILVWVEDCADELFWGHIFPESYQGRKVRFKYAYGNPILKFAEDVAEGSFVAVVAMDSDYDELERYKPHHAMVVKTGRYSIENFLYVPDNIDMLLSVKTRNKAKRGIGARWESHVCAAIEKMVHLDFVSVTKGASARVLGDNCCRFMQKAGWRFDQQQIAAHIESILHNRNGILDMMVGVEELFRGRRLLFFIRGKFLSHAVYRLLRSEMKRAKRSQASVPIDDLFDECFLIWKSSENYAKDILKEQAIAACAEYTKKLKAS